MRISKYSIFLSSWKSKIFSAKIATNKKFLCIFVPPTTNIKPQMEDSKTFSIDFQYFRYLNLAMVQNKYPITKSIAIEYNGEETKENLVLEITPGADFATKFQAEIGKLEPGDKIDLPVKTDVNQAFVQQLSEEMETDFTVAIKYGDNAIYTSKFPMTVLPSEFFIHGFIPELLASFVMPN